MTATLFFVTNIVMLYDTYNRESKKCFCVIIQISRISKSGVFKGGISPSGLSPLALYADYPFIIRSYAIYKRQGKSPDGFTHFSGWNVDFSIFKKTKNYICYIWNTCFDWNVLFWKSFWNESVNAKSNVYVLFLYRSTDEWSGL